MKSITIHGLNDQLDRLIRKRAQKKGLSLNKTIKQLLEISLGLQRKKTLDHREEFLDLFGTWNKNDQKKFIHLTKDFNKIDREDW
jgi:hypothetical protein